MWKKYLFVISLILPLMVSAQSWEWAKSYGTSTPVLVDKGVSISRDAADNLYVSGFTWQPGGGGSTGWTNHWLKKFDAQGNHIWSDTIPFYTNTKNITDEDGNTYVAGNGKIVKYNTNGMLLWDVSARIDFNDLAFSERGIVVSGFTWSYPATLGSYNIPSETGVILECDKNGHLLWLNQQDKFGPGAIKISQTGVIHVQGLGYGQDSSIVRLFDSNGNYFKGLLKTKNVLPLLALDKTNSIYLIVGIMDYAPLIINSDTIRCNCGTASNKVIVKFDANGDYKWHKLIKDNITIESLIVDEQNNVYIGGNILRTLQIDSFLLDNKGSAIYVAKFKPDGTLTWLNYSDQPSSNTGIGMINSLILDSKNNPILTGGVTDKHIFGDVTVVGTNNMYSDVLIAKLNQPTSVNEDQPQISYTSGLSVFPNPTNGIFTISYHADEIGDLKLNVMNYLGQTVISKQYSQQKQINEAIDLSRLAKGVYFVQVNSDFGTEVTKIVLE